MSNTFNPGIAGYVASGKKATRAPYASGAAGHAQSLALMKSKIREGRQDPDLVARAGQVLHAAGIDGRRSATARQITECLLAHVRAETVYTPDAVGSEVIQSAAATLCLRPGLCIRRGDCDDMVVLLCCLLLAVGVTCQIVKEDYGKDARGNDIQSHVLVGVQDEKGEWFYADPSTLGALETFRDCKNREWIDPMDGAQVEIVGIGRPYVMEPARAGLGATGSVQIPGQWTPTQDNAVTAGLRYAWGVIAPPTLGWTAATVAAFYAGPSPAANLGLGVIGAPSTTGPTFLVEQVIPGSTNSSWVLIGIARSTGTVPATETAVNVSVAAVLAEVPPITQTPITPTGPTTLAPPAPYNAIGLSTVLLWGLGAAAAGGIAWQLYKKGYLR